MKRAKVWWLAGVLALALGPAASGGCRWSAVRPIADASPPPGAGAITITDDLGREVKLVRPARRIASLSPSHSEILHAIGCGGQIVLRDRASDFPRSIRSRPATDPFRLSPDHLAGFSPDLVLLSHHDPGRLAALERIELPVAVLDPPTFERVLTNIVTIGRLCGREDQAKRLAARLRQRFERVKRAQSGRRRLRVYIEIDGSDPARPWTAGPRSFVGHLVRLAGGDNVIGTVTERAYIQVSAETIVRADPEVIVFAGTGPAATAGDGLARLRRRRGWQQITAVKAGRVIDRIHADLLSRPGPRLVDGLEALAAALHPGSAEQRGAR